MSNPHWVLTALVGVVFRFLTACAHNGVLAGLYGQFVKRQSEIFKLCGEHV